MSCRVLARTPVCVCYVCVFTQWLREGGETAEMARMDGRWCEEEEMHAIGQSVSRVGWDGVAATLLPCRAPLGNLMSSTVSFQP